MVRLRPVWMTNHPPSVLWHCWLGHQTCKKCCLQNDLLDCSTQLNLLDQKLHYTNSLHYSKHMCGSDTIDLIWCTILYQNSECI